MGCGPAQSPDSGGGWAGRASCDKVGGQPIPAKTLAERIETLYLHKRSENLGSHKNVYMNTHSSVVHIRRKWRQQKCLLTDEWIRKMWVIPAMGHYLATKRDEVLTN